MNIDIDEFNKGLIDYLKQEFPKTNRNLLIIWRPWIGKTYLCKHLIEHDYFIDEPTLRQKISSRHQLLRPPESWWGRIDLYPLDALSKLPVVIYDDYWVGNVTDAYREKMQFRINKRLERWLRTIYTTNLATKDDLIAREARIASRILENADIYVCAWRPDKREQSSKIIS